MNPSSQKNDCLDYEISTTLEWNIKHIILFLNNKNINCFIYNPHNNYYILNGSDINNKYKAYYCLFIFAFLNKNDTL